MNENPLSPPAITLEWIEEQEAFYRGKLASLGVLKRALLDVAPPEKKPFTPRPSPSRSQESLFQKTVLLVGRKKTAILRAIAGPANGLTTQEIVSACLNAGLEGTNQANTSPQLSLYKKQGFIRLADSRWVITEKGQLYLEAQKN